MKLLITSRADDNIKKLTKLTFPVIKQFARKWGADFMRLDHVSGCTVGDGKWHYRILKHYELLQEYDRILHLDSDILLNKNCPNIFEEVPYEKIGTLYEDVGSRTAARRKLINDVQQKFGNVGWSSGYINTGVFLTSNIHKDIFQTINEEYWTGIGFDDVHLGYLINKFQFPVHQLDFRFNHMSMFSEEWNNCADRLNSYVIHYAGKKIKNREFEIEKDIKIIYGDTNFS